MGIYDREYYRREGPSFLDSFQLRGQVCKWLIVLNILIFAIQLLTRRGWPPNGGLLLFYEPGPFTNALILNTDAVLQGQVWRLLTYAFLHDPGVGFAPGQWYFHIIFNMWFLWMFGSEMEELYGPREFLGFYLVSALVGGLAFLGVGATTGQKLCLGASGAVTAVMVLYALHFPRRNLLLFFVLPMPVWIFVAFQVVQDTFLFMGDMQPLMFPGAEPLKSRVAVSVHLGGALFALLYHQFHWRLTGFWPRLRAWKAQRSRPRLRVFREEEERTPEQVPAGPAAHDVDEQLEAKLDAVLEKVARSGQASLTESERQILLRASEIYKRRRS
jgi:membrane associated rhomboid family serine protease